MKMYFEFTEVGGEERPAGKARGNKLARRARSFKEDFLEKLSQMRSPGGGTAAGGGGGGGSAGGTRAASPSSPRPPLRESMSTSTSASEQMDKNPLRDLHVHVRQVQLALGHFRDVVSKNKLEMLPGNGTIVLDTVTTIHTLLKSYLLYDNRFVCSSLTSLSTTLINRQRFLLVKPSERRVNGPGFHDTCHFTFKIKRSNFF